MGRAGISRSVNAKREVMTGATNNGTADTNGGGNATAANNNNGNTNTNARDNNNNVEGMTDKPRISRRGQQRRTVSGSKIQEAL